MTFVGWFVVWIILSGVGLTAVYRTGLLIERKHPGISVFYFVLLSTGVLVASYVTAVRLIGIDQVSCEEMDPSEARLRGASPSEFRARCIATQNSFESLNWRKS